jgi:anaerobic carbon-monoxide dehydrogenase iron sulfur subunit
MNLPVRLSAGLKMENDPTSNRGTQFHGSGNTMEIRREQLLIDPKKCTGCARCMMACAMKHHGTVDPHLSRVSVLRFKDPALNVPVICMACDKAPCIKVCPMNARVRAANGTVVTDTEVCIGCRACVYICPVGSPVANPYTGQTMTCDMCQEDKAGPWCVTACKEEGALCVTKSDALTSPIIRARAGQNRKLYPHASHP